MKRLALVILLLPTLAWGETLTGQASIVDADTIEIHGERIRLEDIDAPESRQTCTDAAGAEYRCGQVAALALAERIGRATVTCEGEKRDRYIGLDAGLGHQLAEQFLHAFHRHSDSRGGILFAKRKHPIDG